MSKEEEFFKEYKTLIRELVQKLFETTNDPGDFNHARQLLDALKALETPPPPADYGYY